MATPGRSLPQVKKYLGVLFSTETVVDELHCCNERRAELQGKAFYVLVNLHSYPHLWSSVLGHDRKDKIQVQLEEGREADQGPGGEIIAL